MNKTMEMNFSQFCSMFGKTEIECGVAEVVNKSMWDGCKLADVHFDKGDFKEPALFDYLQRYDWLTESHGKYRLDAAAVKRVHQRYPNL